MKKSITLILAMIIMGLGRIGTAEVVDRVVAVVGTEMITQSDVKHYEAQRSANARLLGFSRNESKDPLDSLIREKLLKLELERLGVTISDREIDAAIQEILQRNRISLDNLKNEIGKQGLSLDQYRKGLGDQLKQMRFLSQTIFPRIKLSDEDINRKAGPNPNEESRARARLELMQARSSDELVKYLDEARTKTYVEIKK